MARKLSSEEAQLFAEAVAQERPSLVTDADMVLRGLAQRRDVALELSPESGVWFGDKFPGTSGFPG